jgi:hypothetical protein
MLAKEDRERASGTETLLHLHLYVTPSTLRGCFGSPAAGAQRLIPRVAA